MSTEWRYLDHVDVTAAAGLAVDDCLTELQGLKNQHSAPIIRLYNYEDHCALVGRFQNLEAEVNIPYCESHGYGFSRRKTGGGAIMMGRDQLGICITSNQHDFPWQHISELYSQLSAPIIEALKKLGIEASFRSKNDLEVNGKKIAGLGVYITPGGAFQFHASLLNEIAISQMLEMLHIPIQKFSDKRKISTVKDRITSIGTERRENLQLSELKSLIRTAYEEYFGIKTTSIPLTDVEIERAREIENSTYNNPEWLYQHSPQADMTGMSLKKTKAGLLRTYIGLKGENIKSVLITGDFLHHEELFRTIESRLKWSPLDREKIIKTITEIIESDDHVKMDHSALHQEQITDAIWIAAQRAIAAAKYTYQGSCYYPKTENVG